MRAIAMPVSGLGNAVFEIITHYAYYSSPTATCAILKYTGQVKCVGTYYLHGYAAVELVLAFPSASVDFGSFSFSGTDIEQVTTGTHSTLVRFTDGRVKSFGKQFLYPSYYPDPPIHFPGESTGTMGNSLPFWTLKNVTYLSQRGIYSGCLIVRGGDVYCTCVDPFVCTIGDGSNRTSTVPIKVPGIKAKTVEAGMTGITCAILMNDSIACELSGGGD